MGVEEPASLVALAAAAVPLLLHLRSRSSSRTVRFPNVGLVREVARDLRRSSVLADAWLVAARAGVVALAALALSRPYVGAHPPAGGVLAEGDVLVMLDRSSAWGDAHAFEEAHEAAGEVIDLVERRGRATLLPFDDLPGPAIEGRVARAALAGIRPTGRARSMAAALSTAARLPRAAGAGHARTFVLLTTPDGAAEALATGRRAGDRLVAYAVGGASAGGDLAVTHASLEGRTVRMGGKIRVRARIARRRSLSTQRLMALPGGRRELRLFLDEDARPSAAIELPAFVPEAGELTVLVETPRRRPGSSLLRVELHPPDASPADDRRFLVLPALERIRVVALLPEGRGSAADLQALRRAVAALAAARASPAVLPIEERALPASGLTREALDAFDALAVGDVEAIPPALWETLAAFVREGGAILALAPGKVPSEARRLFGIGPAEDDARSTPVGGTSLLGGDFDDDSRRAGALRLLARARFPSYLRLPDRTPVALRFSTGGPALVGTRFGRGRASLFAAGVGHLARQPSVLVPLVDALLRRAAVRPCVPLAVDAGLAPLALGFAPHRAPERLALLSPEGERIDVRIAGALPRGRLPGRGRASAILPCERPGLWRLLAGGRGVSSGAAGGEHVEAIIGVNAEASPEAAARPAPPPGGRVVGTRSELLALLGGRGSVGLAPVLALAALAALAAELALVALRSGRGGGASVAGVPVRKKS